MIVLNVIGAPEGLLSGQHRMEIKGVTNLDLRSMGVASLAFRKMTRERLIVDIYSRPVISET
jgi:hypothetical protein